MRDVTFDIRATSTIDHTTPTPRARPASKSCTYPSGPWQQAWNQLFQATLGPTSLNPTTRPQGPTGTEVEKPDRPIGPHDHIRRQDQEAEGSMINSRTVHPGSVVEGLRFVRFGLDDVEVDVCNQRIDSRLLGTKSSPMRINITGQTPPVVGWPDERRRCDNPAGA